MYPHTVTLYNRLPEVARVAAWRRTVLAGVRVEEKSGAVASLIGSTSTDGVLVFIPGGIGGYVAPEAFTNTGWTLREGDVLVVGEHTAAAPDETASETYRIKGVETLRLRSRVHHWEVAGA